MNTTSGVLSGDGRSIIRPIYTERVRKLIKLGVYASIKRGAARRMIKSMLADKVYRSYGSTLWLAVAYCDENKLRYTLNKVTINNVVHGFELRLT